MKLNEVYSAILAFAGLEADGDGYISTIINDRREPAVLGGLRLVLPMDQHLRNPNPKEKVIFHPLSENILRGESEVITKLRDIINIRLNFTFGIICHSLLSLAASPEEHHKLSPDQTELLIALKDVDTTTAIHFSSLIIEGIKNQANKLFMNIYLKRGGSIGDKRYSRAGILTFSLYEELMKDAAEVYGVKLRVKDKEALKQLYQFVLPGIESDVTCYNRGSDSTIAPYLDALMKTAMTIASRFNDIFDQYGAFIEYSSDLVFNGDWVETFENLNVMSSELRRVPAQMGNEGTIAQTEQPVQQSVQHTLPVTVPQQQHTIPMPQQVQAFPSTTPQYPPYPQSSPPPVRQTGRGIEWTSVMQNNPQVGMSGNALGVHFAQQQYVAQNQFQPAAFANGMPPPAPMHPYANAGYGINTGTGYIDRRV